ncbi:MAG: phosphoribosylaminoimidazolesuccinocarboxamide synthase [bacterium]|nr:phosphoribosylaminoimidazolesuccinocarboxamide synthase [bacterium]
MKPLATGKTKSIYPLEVAVPSKDIVTWGNDKQAPMPGKAAWSTTTTANMFRVLKDASEEVAFSELLSSDTFAAPYCDMIKLEVVCRLVVEPGSSYLKRHPITPIGVSLSDPIIEFFLKSSGRMFGGIPLPDDDPFVTRINKGGLWVHHPGRSVNDKDCVFIPATIFGYEGDLEELSAELIARTKSIGRVVRDAWARHGWHLGDFKIEFGVTWEGQILLADVLDNDSWRLQDPDGKERSKQTIRDRSKRGDPLEEILAEASINYALVAAMSDELVYAP